MENNKTFKVFGEKGCNNDIVMAFFGELFQFSGVIRSVYALTKNRYIELSDPSKTIDLHDAGAAEELVSFFAELYSKEEESDIPISAEHLDPKKEEKCTLSYHKEPGVFVIESHAEENIAQLKLVEQNLENTFIDTQVKEELQQKLQQLCMLYKKQEKAALWKRKEIFEYLNLYYRLLSIFIYEESTLPTDGVAEKVLLPLLNLGIHEKTEGNARRADMTSPVVLSAMNLIYDRIGEYVRLPIYSDPLKNSFIKDIELSIYKNIFTHKIHQIFRYYAVFKTNDQLYHAALPAYVPADSHREPELGVPVRALSSYNSFQGIKELRLGEKILYELRLHMEAAGKQKNKFLVIIVGESDPQPLEELIRYVSRSIQYKEEYKILKEADIHFEVYTLRTPDKETGTVSNYTYEFKPYMDMLMNKDLVEDILNRGDVLFLLDNRQLYELEIDEIKDHLIFKQSVLSESYEEFYHRNRCSDLKLDCKFLDLYNALVSYSWKGTLGFLRKKAKESLIKYIQTYIQESKNSQPKTLYMYISDINALKRLSCIQKQVVRIEKYNQKEIGIVRFTTHSKERLKAVSDIYGETQKRILVFNMWQFVKHLMIDQREEMEQLYITDPEKHFLDEIFIGIDYTDWRHALKVKYQCDYGNEERVKETVKLMFDFLSSEKPDNMYRRYLKKSFVSFLYGSAQSVEDLVFLYIFKQHGERLGEYKPAEQDKELQRHYNVNCKYSHKKNYWDAIERLEQETVTYIDWYQIRNSAAIDDSGSGTPGWGFKETIQEACENIGYEDSRLYRNCQAI